MARSVVEQWQLRLPDDGADTHTIPLPARPMGSPASWISIWKNENGVWQKVPTTEIGSYLSFEASGQTVQLAALSTFPVWWVWIVLAGLAALLVLLIIHLIHKTGKKRRRQMQALRKAMQDEQNANDAVIGVIDQTRRKRPSHRSSCRKRRKAPRLVDHRACGRDFDRRRDPHLPGQSQEQRGRASAAEKPLRQEGAGHDRVRADGAWRRDAANGRAPVPHAGRWEHHPLHRGQRRAAVLL